MIDGLFVPAIRDIDYLAPSAPYPLTQSGIQVGQNAIYRYAIPTDEQPTLTIVDYIPDYNGNFIKPGHYQLALSNDKEFLYLLQSKDLIATIPVFKLAENKEELKKYRNKKELTKSEKRELKREERENIRKDKFQKIIDAKYAKTASTVPKRDYEHMEATIDYIKEGHYYLVRYEKGFLRAWGAIKVAN